MSKLSRPAPVGRYEVLQDAEGSEASVRVIKIANADFGVDPHVHMRSSQIYIALAGKVVINVEGVETVLEPYQTLNVAIGVLHSARAIDGVAVVANISVPPLGADDQLPRSPEIRRSDFDLPTIGSDFDD